MKIDGLSKKIKVSFLNDLGDFGFNNFFHVSNDYLVGEKRLFGTYYIPYLSEMIGLKNEKSMVNIGNAFLFGRAFVISQDQVLDNREKPNIDYLLLSPVLLEEFIYKLYASIKKFNLEKEIRRILFDSVMANKNEQNEHKNKITSYSKKDLQSLYLKTGIVGIPPIIICCLVNKPQHKNRLLSIARNLLVCIQICDDLSDVAEDYNSKNFTLPVTHGILLSGDNKINIESVYEGLLLGGLLESLCTFIITSLNKIIRDIKKISNKETQMKLYVLNLKSRIEEILKNIKEIKTKKGINASYQEDFTKLKPLKEVGEYRSMIHLLKKFEPANIAPNKLIRLKRICRQRKT